MQNAADLGLRSFAKVALRFLPQSCLIYPVILNSILFLYLGHKLEWKVVSGFKKSLLELLPTIGITAAIGFGSIDPMQHPDIPLFTWLFLMVECLLISVWLLLSLGDRWLKKYLLIHSVIKNAASRQAEDVEPINRFGAFRDHDRG